MQKILTERKILALILFLVTVLYIGTVTHGFVWDDHSFIEEWPEIKSVQNVGKILTGSYPTWHSGKYRPVKGIILTLDYALFKTDSFMYHAQAIGIYVAIILLLYFFLCELTQNNKLALLATFIFAIHPAHVEAITFITSSIDMVGAMFMFLSLLSYLYSKENSIYRNIYLLISFISAFLAFLSYEATLILPLIIGLIEFVSIRQPTRIVIARNVETKQSSLLCSVFKKTLPYVFFAIVYLGLRYFFLKSPSDTPYIENSFWFTFLTMTKVFVRYIELFFLPVKLTMEHVIAPGITSQIEVSYVKEAILGQSIFDPLTLLGLSIFILLSGTLFIRKKYPWIFFGSWFALISFLPFSFIVPLPTLMTERYLFLSSVGLSLLFAYIILQVSNLFRTKGYKLILGISIFTIIIGLFSFYAYKTYTRNSDWKDEISFWSAEAKTVPESVVIRHNLGVAYRSRGEFDLAEPHLVWAATHNTACQPRIFQSLGNLYVEKKQWESAMDQFARALLCDKNNYQSFYYLGRMYEVKDDFVNAEKTYQDAISISPQASEARLALGIVLVKQKKYLEAETAFLETINIDPYEMAAYTNLILLYQETDEEEKLKNALTKALALFPTSMEIQSLGVKFGR